MFNFIYNINVVMFYMLTVIFYHHSSFCRHKNYFPAKINSFAKISLPLKNLPKLYIPIKKWKFLLKFWHLLETNDKFPAKLTTLPPLWKMPRKELYMTAVTGVDLRSDVINVPIYIYNVFASIKCLIKTNI